ncbi:MAG: lipoyl(octanoyl) transferase LipB [Ignavibacteriaceae bacterium]
MREILYCDQGILDYKEAWDIQSKIHAKRVANRIPDLLFLLEHPNTYTLGKIAKKEHLIGSKEYLADRGISVYEIDRGGDITYHGPGQLVGYPIISLTDWVQDSHKYLRALEEVIILTCNYFNLEAGRNEKHTGVWIGDSKIAAIGIKISRWVTMHGFAFNINTDLSLFNGIIPCGISDKGVTSLRKEMKVGQVDMGLVKEVVLRNFQKVFNYESYREIKYNEIINYPESENSNG